MGKLQLDKIAGEALSNKEDKDEAEPVVLAYVRIDNDDLDHAQASTRLAVPPEMLLSGTEVHAKSAATTTRWAIRCSTACGNSCTRRSCSSSKQSARAGERRLASPESRSAPGG